MYDCEEESVRLCCWEPSSDVDFESLLDYDQPTYERGESERALYCANHGKEDCYGK